MSSLVVDYVVVLRIIEVGKNRDSSETHNCAGTSAKAGIGLVLGHVLGQALTSEQNWKEPSKSAAASENREVLTTASPPKRQDGESIYLFLTIIEVYRLFWIDCDCGKFVWEELVVGLLGSTLR